VVRKTPLELSIRPEHIVLDQTSPKGEGADSWHSDNSFMAEPPKAAILKAIHDITKPLRKAIDAGHAKDDADLRAAQEQWPPVEHPVVRTHPVTGRKLLYVNRLFVSHIVGLPADESTALIDRLCRRSDVPEYQVRYRWTPDSIVFWDNRAVQHFACSDYWPEVRVMERASVVGTRPT
jgi:alpha-ketoglutarate-dependent taurine dioxygenase